VPVWTVPPFPDLFELPEGIAVDRSFEGLTDVVFRIPDARLSALACDVAGI
jgi:hypothetical protein